MEWTIAVSIRLIRRIRHLDTRALDRNVYTNNHMYVHQNVKIYI